MALREVDLIPGEILYRRNVKRHACFWGVCLAIALTLVLGIYLHQAKQTLVRKQAVMKLKDQHKELGTKIEEIRLIQGELGRLTDQQAALSSITAHMPYSQLLLRLAEIMNEHTWLTQLTIEGGGTGGRANLKLAGFSHSNKDLGDLLNRLTNEPMFKAVVLDYAREAHSKDAASPSTLIRFQISGHA